MEVAQIINFLGIGSIILAALLLLMVIGVIILVIIQKSLKKKFTEREEIVKKENSLVIEIFNLTAQNKKPSDLLEAIDRVARKFLTENFGVQRGQDYVEMTKLFKERSKGRIVSFCQNMSNALYSGESLTDSQVKNIVNELVTIIREESHTHTPPQVQQRLQEPIKQEAQIQQRPPQQFSITPKREDTMKKLNNLDEKQVKDAYEELQRRFEKAYNMFKKQNNASAMKRLEDFRKIIVQRINDYSKDSNKIVALAEEISRGVRILRELGAY